MLPILQELAETKAKITAAYKEAASSTGETATNEVQQLKQAALVGDDLLQVLHQAQALMDSASTSNATNHQLQGDAQALMVQLSRCMNLANDLCAQLPELISSSTTTSTARSSTRTTLQPSSCVERAEQPDPDEVRELFSRLRDDGNGSAEEEEEVCTLLRALDSLLDTRCCCTQETASDNLSLLFSKLLDPEATDKVRELCLAVILHLNGFYPTSSSSYDFSAASSVVVPALLPHIAASASPTTQLRALSALVALTAIRPTAAQAVIFTPSAVISQLVQYLATTESTSECKLLAFTALYQLSSAPSNHSAMRRSLLPTLLDAINNSNDDEEAASIYAALTLASLSRATNDQPARLLTKPEFDRLFLVLKLMDAGHEPWALHPPLLPMRWALAFEANSKAFWTWLMSEDVDLHVIVHLHNALVRAMLRADAVTMENALAIFIQLSGHAGARRMVRQLLPDCAYLIDPARYVVASRAGKLFMLRLEQTRDEDYANDAGLSNDKKVASTAAVHRLDVEAAISTCGIEALPNFVRMVQTSSSRGEKHWDSVQRQLGVFPSVSQAFFALLTMGAPFRLFEFALKQARVDDNVCFSAKGSGVNISPLVMAMLVNRVDVAMLMLDHRSTRVAVATLIESSHRDDGDSPLLVSFFDANSLPVSRLLVALLGEADDKKKRSEILDVCLLGDVSAKTKGCTALLLCCTMPNSTGVDQARLLLEAGASPHFVPGSRLQPLACAAEQLNLPMIRLLLKHGADPNEIPEGFVAPLFKLFSALQTKPPVTDEDENVVVEIFNQLIAHGANLGSTTFVEMYNSGRMFPRLIRRWVEVAVADVNAGLYFASKMGRAEDARFFLQMGADPNFMLDGCYSTMCGAVTSLTSSSDEMLDVLRVLIQAGADVHQGLSIKMSHCIFSYSARSNLADTTTCCVMLSAVSRGRIGVVQLLLQAGGTDRRDATGYSLMDCAKHFLPSIVPWLDGTQDFGLFDEQGEGLRFVQFTHCANCRKRGQQGVLLPACAGCMMVAYCGPECQREHWTRTAGGGHARICKKKREMEEERRRAREE